MTFLTDLFVFNAGVNTTLEDYLCAFLASEFKKCGSDFTLMKRLIAHR
jgi:hypothetical protein